MLTKICNNPNCEYWGNPQLLINFHTTKSNYDGYHNECKVCRKIREKERYHENREKLLENKREYWIENKDKITEYKQINKEHISKRMKEYRNSPAIWLTYGIQLERYEECRQDPNNPELLQVRCIYDQNWFNPTNAQAHKRLNSITGQAEGEHRFYCSSECKDNCPIFKRIKFRKDQVIKNLSKEVNPQFRKMVFEKDNYACQKCEKTKDVGVELHCHHINPRVISPLEECDIDNGITLCKECHKQIHFLDGCTIGELKKCANRLAALNFFKNQNDDIVYS